MAKKKTFKGGNFDRRGKTGPNKTSDKHYTYGKGPSGNAYKTEGGYSQAGTAGIIPKVPDSIGTGKFGASADVQHKLTFGLGSSTIQPGFMNDIWVLNNIKSGTVGINADFGYNNTTGTAIPGAGVAANASRTAGVVGVQVTDYLGANNNEEKSPLNLAAQLNKQFIDTSLGEQIGFSSSDLGVYMGAVKSLWDMVYYIKRAINLSHNSKNRADYLTRGVYRAMYICQDGHTPSNPDPSLQIAARSAIYLERLNGMIKRINTVPVPVNMKWLVSYTEPVYSQIFQDEPGETAQLYVVCPRGFYYYDETATGSEGSPKEFYNGAELKWIQLDQIHTDGYCSIPDLLDTLESMVQAVTTHTNSDAMAQKLLNAFGTANTLQIPTNQVSDELVPIVYDPDFLSALENAVLVPIATLEKPAYSIDAAREMIVGRPLFTVDPANVNPDALAAIVNIPLQFHDGVDKVDDHAISNALRWHPYTSFVRKGSTGLLEFDFANNFGMQIVNQFVVISLQTADALERMWVTGRFSLWNTNNALQDFKWIPIGVCYDTKNSVVSGSTGVSLKRIAYNARRDVEVTMNGEVVANYFWALAEMVWDVVDGQTQFTGQRSKIG